MSTNPPPQPTPRGPALVVLACALLLAVSPFVLPALDAGLPGGSIVWQVGAVVLALAGAWWGWRHLPVGGRWGRARLGRLVAIAAVLIALAWVAGVAFLWLIWPR
jgi:protein-S-isoprenylcysteine O-methyltransferase Ste14